MRKLLLRAGKKTVLLLILIALPASTVMTPAALSFAADVAVADVAVADVVAADVAAAGVAAAGVGVVGADVVGAGAIAADVAASDVAAAGVGEPGDILEIADPGIPLAGWSLMWLDRSKDTDSIVCYGKGDATVFVPLSYVIDDRIYFFGYPYNSYYSEPNAKEFSDIGGHWAAENILFIAGREASLGFPDGSFEPNAPMTRAMLATVLARMIIADLSDFNYRMFDDVDPEAWYGPPVAWAYEYGVVEGIGGGKFDPNGNVTRQDMCLMIERFLDAFGIELLTPADVGAGDDDAFLDDDRIGFWAADAVAHMSKHGIMHGRPGNLFDPRGFSTRAEVATVLFRLVESAVTEAYNRL